MGNKVSGAAQAIVMWSLGGSATEQIRNTRSLQQWDWVSIPSYPKASKCPILFSSIHKKRTKKHWKAWYIQVQTEKKTFGRILTRYINIAVCTNFNMIHIGRL